MTTTSPDTQTQSDPQEAGLKYVDQGAWLDACDAISMGRYGYPVLDLVECDEDVAVDVLMTSFANDEEPEQGVAAVRKLHAKELWAKFGDIPLDEDTDNIDEPFLHFEAGTDRFDIWHWFEESFDVCIAEDLAIGANTDSAHKDHSA